MNTGSSHVEREEKGSALRRHLFFLLSAFVLLFLLLPLVSISQTPTRVAILELKNEAGITGSEAYYLTDKVRDAASRVLARRGFLVITRESLQELLPPGTDLASCTTADLV